jgi:uncharacterized small protein (DUF1192 family)
MSEKDSMPSFDEVCKTEKENACLINEWKLEETIKEQEQKIKNLEFLNEEKSMMIARLNDQLVQLDPSVLLKQIGDLSEEITRLKAQLEVAKFRTSQPEVVDMSEKMKVKLAEDVSLLQVVCERMIDILNHRGEGQ